MSEQEPTRQEPEEVTDSTELEEEDLDEVAGGGVLALDMDVVHKSSGHQTTTAVPDVSETPGADSSTIPQPNIAEAGGAAAKAKKVVADLPKKKRI